MDTENGCMTPEDDLLFDMAAIAFFFSFLVDEGVMEWVGYAKAHAKALAAWEAANPSGSLH